jgi:glucosamine-6-phosphate deaminase
MKIHVSPDPQIMGAAAAAAGARLIRAELAARGAASIIVATGASQFQMLEALVREPDIRWDLVTVFHLDEYVRLPLTHPASFRRYLWERFHSQLPLPVAAFHYLNAESEPEALCARMKDIISTHDIAVAFIGIGENGHVAFNDPPADFDTQEPYIIVRLDEACRRQQLGEGWFPTLEDVPQEAVSMSVRQILRSRSLIVTVPDTRKAVAVRDSVTGPVTPQVPGSILHRHEACELFLDQASAALLPTHGS